MRENHTNNVVHILFREIERNRFSTNPEFLDSILKKYSPYSATFKFCPGIAEATYREYYDVVRFDPKSLRKTESPVFRIDSKLCPMWFELGKFVPVTSRESESVLCRQCNKLTQCLLVQQPDEIFLHYRSGSHIAHAQNHVIPRVH